MRFAWLLVVLAGCFSSGTNTCGDLVCPAGQECAGDRCALPAQIHACDNLAEGDPCSWEGAPSGGCVGHVCLPNGCGNGIVEPGEICDDGNTAPGDGCSSDCRSLETCGNAIKDSATTEQCDCGDGSQPLPAGCNGPNSDTPGATCRPDCTLHRCGDGIVDPLEDCEGANLAGHTCADVGYYSGTPSCNAQCHLDPTGCTGHCGDGTRNGMEACDGMDFGGLACRDYGFHAGTLTCTQGCAIDLGACSQRCGDGILDPGEQCDGAALGNKTCIDLGYYSAATLRCTSGCSYDVSGCTGGRCGDGVVQASQFEECDGSDYGTFGATPPTCTQLGYYVGGAVACTPSCTFDPSMCSGKCGDGIINGNEVCDGSAQTASASCVTYGFDVGKVGCTLACTPSVTQCHRLGWFATAHLPESVTAIWAVSPSLVYAVGANSSVSKFDGTSWTTMMDTPASNPFNAVWASSANDVWAGSPSPDMGNTFLMYHYDGTSWTTNTFLSFVLGLWGTAPNNVYAGTGNGLMHFDGTSWSPVTTGLDQARFIWGASATDIYVAGYAALSSEIVHYNGAAWTVVYTNATVNWTSLTGTSSSNVWATGYSSTSPSTGSTIVWNGSTWTATTHVRGTDNVQVLAAAVTSPTDVFALEDGGHMEHWDGVVWTPVAQVTSEPMPAVAVPSAGVAFAGAQDGTIYSYFGGYWASLPSGVTQSLNGVWSDGIDDAFAVGDHDPSGLGKISLLHYDGTQWINNGPTGTTDFSAVYAASSSFAVAGGSSTIDQWGGSSWTTAVSASGKTFETVWGSSANDVWASGTDLRHYNGTSWSIVSATPARSLTGTASNDVWGLFWQLLGGNITLEHYNGTSWSGTMFALSQQPTDIWTDAASSVWAVGPAGYIAHYNGTTWSESPALTAANLNAVWFASPNDGFAVGDGGVILHYLGAASGWQPVFSGTFANLTDVHGSGSKVFFATADGQILVLVRSCTTCF